MIYIKEIIIKDNIQYEIKKPWFEVIRGADGGELCFNDSINPKYGEAITVRASDLKVALDYFYGSKATWNIQRIQKNNENIIKTIATSEMQIKYEVAYCLTNHGAFPYNERTLLASFRLINK